MNYHNIHIRRFIILYIVCFGLLSSLFITLFAYFFGLTAIQENYTKNYVQATFETFDTDMTALVKRNNTVLFNISSNDTLLATLLSTNMSLQEQQNSVQVLLEEILDGYDEIRQIDIIFPTSQRYTYVSSAYDEKLPLPLPSDDFLSNLSDRMLNLFDCCIFDQTDNPCLVFARNTGIGSIILYLNETAVSSLYESSSLKNSIIFLSNNGRIVSCSDTSYIGLQSSLHFMETLVLSSSQENPVYTYSVEIPALGERLELTYILSNKDLYQTTSALNRILLISLFLAVVVCLFMVLLISKKLINNISSLRKNLDLFSKDYMHTFSIAKHSELEELEWQFINMSDRIRILIQNIEKEREQKRIAELRALQSQINPHFIYNSIDAISWMAKLKKPYSDIEKLSYHLGMFFRLGLHKGENIITIAEELQHVRSYLEIEKIRFPDMFDVKVEADPEVMDYKVIKIILQPLVENAINHGFRGINYKGLITIRISTAQDAPAFLNFQVDDNGKGMDFSGSSLPQSKSKSGGYGLVNVNERLIMEYGHESALCFKSKPDIGTTVSFLIEKKYLF
ncbi:MAG: sensor histidine kinase [Roseburia sp.]|nr:sensor histidine kinase [Roseburia sp.]